MSADTCPICTEPQLVSIQPGIYECRFCKAQIVNGRLICPACKRANDIGLENCSICGEPLTIVAAVISRQAAGQGSQRLEQLKGQAREIKAQAEVHSQARMTDFQEVDHRRIESEREASVQQRLKDQIIFKYTAIGLGSFLLLVAIISLIVLL
jgi:hypothetical protein